MTKNRFLTIASEYLSAAQSKRKRMRHFRCRTTKLKLQMTVWNIDCTVKKKKERSRERQKGETKKSELPQKSSREPFSRMKKPHRKSVNLKDHDQLGKRNREKRSLRERLSVANLHRIRSLIKKRSLKELS